MLKFSALLVFAPLLNAASLPNAPTKKPAVTAERRAPMFIVSSAYPNCVRGHRYNVLQLVDVPAVLVEMFNIRNAEQARYFADDANMCTYMQHVAAGIQTFAECLDPPAVQVVIDNGHGELEPGAYTRLDGRQILERDYAISAQTHLQQALNQHLTVHRLTFTAEDYLHAAEASQKFARLTFFIGSVNRLAAILPRQTLYVSLHVERGLTNRPLPTMVYTPYVPENQCRQKASVRLAEEIIAACRQLPWQNSTMARHRPLVKTRAHERTKRA